MTVLHGETGVEPTGPVQTASSGRRFGLTTDGWILVAAVVVPPTMAVVLIPWRDQLDKADGALFLVVAIVGVASTGRRLAAAVAALTAALAFDYFLTRPYESFRITNHADFITELLLLVVGLAVGELAARGRRHRDDAWQRRHEMTVLHSVTELAATGSDPELVTATAAAELQDLLMLRDCRFSQLGTGGATARINPDGQVTVGPKPWSTDALGLPTDTVDLPVRSGGWLLGHFLLTPTPGKPVPHERLIVAVSLADQVGAALAADHAPGGTVAEP